MAEGRTLGDPETIHFGMVPRTNRGVFCLNELPDLAERIQVALLNVLEERDIGVRGYSLRLPLDLVLVASANPEDYTNRGRIITPLKDRFGAEVRTHYPLSLTDELALITQEAEVSWDGRDPGAELPEHLIEVIARFTRLVRESPAVDGRSGVSARFAIAAAESAAAAAVRRTALNAEARDETPVARVGDLPGIVPTLRGKVEFEVSEEGREEEILGPPAAPRHRRDVPRPARRRRPDRAAGQVRGRRHDRVGRARLRHRTAPPHRRGPRPGQDHEQARHGRPRVVRRGRRGGGVRPRGPVPDPPALQGQQRWNLHLPVISQYEEENSHFERTRGPSRSGQMANYRYGPYDDGPDPLAPPYDVREALDEMGERILGGDNTRDALRDLLRRGWQDRQGLDDLMRRVRERQRELRNSGRLDGMLDQARELLDEAIETERGELFPDPSDDARLREAELDTLPNDTSRAIRQLAEYDWRSQAAREKFEQLRDLLRREVLDSQFQGMKQALENPDPAAMQRVKDMLADLRQMLDADTSGEHTQQDFDQFMGAVRRHVPGQPAEPGGAGRLAGPPDAGRPAAARVAHR